jgi:hypothetical protein
MACFWQAIIARLRLYDQGIHDPRALVRYLKTHNTTQNDITWSSTEEPEPRPLTDKEIQEHYEWIETYDESTIKNGYMCGSCDPFLGLVCKIYGTTITHHMSHSTGITTTTYSPNNHTNTAVLTSKNEHTT